MTRLIQRSDIVDYQTYEDTRASYRADVLELKKPRRVHLGESCENSTPCLGRCH